MPHKTRPRNVRASRAGRFSRCRLDSVDTTRSHRMFHVIYVWGSHDMYQRRHSTYGRREAFRYAKEIAGDGAKIVLVKKGTFHDGMKLIADFSTVGGA